MSYLNKTSLLIPSQLPGFIRDNPDYATFVLFLQAYYEWMEQQGGAVYGTKNLSSYFDIDTTLDQFLQYYRNDFLSFFPDGSLIDQRKLTKIARELYQSKGTPSSYQFLFRILYNSEVDLYNASDYILRASDGKWVLTRSLTLTTIDPTWLSAVNYRLFGETSYGYATIEDVIIGLNSTQIVLSGIDRQFSSGEYVHVVDIHGAPVLFNGSELRAQVLGVLSSVAVDPKFTGSGYNVGDPVVFFGGLNPNITNPVGASGYISQVSGASVTGVTPTYIGQGYRPGSYTEVTITSGSGSGTGARDIATVFDPTSYYVYHVPTDTLGNKATVQLGDGSHLVSYNFANDSIANYNTKLSRALSFPVLNTYGILATTVTSGGTGYDQTTSASAVGFYQTETGALDNLPYLGMLGPIQIVAGGTGYAINDTIVFTGGSGYGAFANVKGVSGNGAITSISFVPDPSGTTLYPPGGMGYQRSLPTLTVHSANGTNAIVTVPGLVGGDAKFGITSTSYGQVQAITLTNPGQDYITAPSISLRVEDMLVYNINVFEQPKQGDVVYQGTLINTTFVANVDSISINTANGSNSYFSTYNLRTYDYNGYLDANTIIKVSRNGQDLGVGFYISQANTGVYTQGRKIYGNGSAKASAVFSNGIILGKGIYLNADGQPSAYSVLENSKYNNYTYILQVEAALAKYKQTALAFLHPSGMNYQAYNVLRNEESYNLGMSSEELSIQSLRYLLDGSAGAFYANATSPNIITTYNTTGANLANVVFANSYLTVYTQGGRDFYSQVTGVTANTITLMDNWNYLVPNVVTATVSANSNTINITGLTDSWNIATGNTVGRFSDFMYINDSVSFDGVYYTKITHVDQADQGTTIKVTHTYPTAQTGFLNFKQNTNSSNIWVSGIVAVPEVTDIITEFGLPLTTEDGNILILG